MNTLNGVTVLGMLVAGLLLSAFFSGSETGFYRVSRLRLVLDGRSGDRIARTLLWLSNRPPLFVATALIGNNLANYLTSLAILLATRILMGGPSQAEVMVPICVAPLVFVYGELLPKKLYYAAPNRLLRAGAPLFWTCFVLFAPIAIVLSWLGRLLQFLLGESPDEVRLRLARSEINQILDEGKETGILRPAQRTLAHAVSALANQRVSRYSVPLHRWPTVDISHSVHEVLAVARHTNSAELLITDPQTKKAIGYVSAAKLASVERDWNSLVQPLATVHTTDSPLAAIAELHKREQTLAEVIDVGNRPVGVVSLSRMMQPLAG